MGDFPSFLGDLIGTQLVKSKMIGYNRVQRAGETPIDVMLEERVGRNILSVLSS